MSRDLCKGVHKMGTIVRGDGTTYPCCLFCGLYPSQIKEKNETLDWSFGYWKRKR